MDTGLSMLLVGFCNSWQNYFYVIILKHNCFVLVNISNPVPLNISTDAPATEIAPTISPKMIPSPSKNNTIPNTTSQKVIPKPIEGERWLCCETILLTFNFRFSHNFIFNCVYCWISWCPHFLCMEKIKNEVYINQVRISDNLLSFSFLQCWKLQIPILSVEYKPDRSRWWLQWPSDEWYQ